MQGAKEVKGAGPEERLETAVRLARAAEWLVWAALAVLAALAALAADQHVRLGNPIAMVHARLPHSTQTTAARVVRNA